MAQLFVLVRIAKVTYSQSWSRGRVVYASGLENRQAAQAASSVQIGSAPLQIMIGKFLKQCDCEYFDISMSKLKIYSTDAEAVASAWEHWDSCIAEMRKDSDNINHHYWLIHGPSGHLCSIRNTPYGTLPPGPQELSAEIAKTYQDNLDNGVVARLQSLSYSPTIDRK